MTSSPEPARPRAALVRAGLRPRRRADGATSRRVAGDSAPPVGLPVLHAVHRGPAAGVTSAPSGEPSRAAGHRALAALGAVRRQTLPRGAALHRAAAGLVLEGLVALRAVAGRNRRPTGTAQRTALGCSGGGPMDRAGRRSRAESTVVDARRPGWPPPRTWPLAYVGNARRQRGAGARDQFVSWACLNCRAGGGVRRARNRAGPSAETPARTATTSAATTSSRASAKAAWARCGRRHTRCWRARPRQADPARRDRREHRPPGRPRGRALSSRGRTHRAGCSRRTRCICTTSACRPEGRFYYVMELLDGMACRRWFRSSAGWPIGARWSILHAGVPVAPRGARARPGAPGPEAVQRDAVRGGPHPRLREGARLRPGEEPCRSVGHAADAGRPGDGYAGLHRA